VDNLGGRGKSILVVVAILSSWGLDVQHGFFNDDNEVEINSSHG
jgi:hypothetical protein